MTNHSETRLGAYLVQIYAFVQSINDTSPLALGIRLKELFNPTNRSKSIYIFIIISNRYNYRHFVAISFQILTNNLKIKLSESCF